MNFDWIDLLFSGGAALLGILVTRGIFKGVLAGLAEHFESIIDKAREGRDAASPNGRAYSNAELEGIFKEVEDLALYGYRNILRSWLARVFGLKSKS